MPSEDLNGLVETQGRRAARSRLSARSFGKLVTALRRQGADPVRKGRRWSVALEDRTLLVPAYWRTNLTMRQLASFFGISKPAADRITAHLGPALALRPRRRFSKDAVLIVDGTPVPTRDHIGVFGLRSQQITATIGPRIT